MVLFALEHEFQYKAMAMAMAMAIPSQTISFTLFRKASALSSTPSSSIRYRFSSRRWLNSNSAPQIHLWQDFVHLFNLFYHRLFDCLLLIKIEYF